LHDSIRTIKALSAQSSKAVDPAKIHRTNQSGCDG
jgi:hypothetical protein